jgi:hypothetical protein
MSQNSGKKPEREVSIDAANLYREETFTDLSVGTIRRLTPVRSDGAADPARPAVFVGQTHVMTAHGAIPVDCEIEAASLEEAVSRYPAAIRKAIEDLVSQARELQRQAASRIVTPGDMLGGGMMPGGAGAGGGGPGGLILK